MNDTFWNDQWSVFEAALAKIETDPAAVDPGLRWTSGYWKPQSVFPFRAYASVASEDRDDEIESIDFSIDSKLEGEQLRISSDICYSDGRLIAEGPVAHEPEGVDREAWIRRHIQEVVEFFQSTVGQLRELIRPRS